MTRKRGNDNIYERSRKRVSVPRTPISKTTEDNALNDSLVELYRQNAENAQNKADKGESSSPHKDKDDGEKSLSQSKQKGKKSIKAPVVKYSNIDFDHVGGMDEILKGILKIIYNIQLGERMEEQSSAFNSARGILLHGPPGCGKTLLAHAIAGQVQLPLLEVAATELVRGVSGESETKIRDTFDEAIKIGSCILFIDEVDAIFPKRDSSSARMEYRMVSQLIKSFDELSTKDPTSKVIVIGATNYADSIDPSLRRQGRFNKEIAIGIPNEEARLQILQLMCKDIKLESDFDFTWVAHHTPGFVGADLKALVTISLEKGKERFYSRLLTSRNMCESTVSVKEFANLIKSVAHLTAEEVEPMFYKLEDFKAALQDVVPFCMREGYASVPEVTWEDVGALENVKNQLRSMILWPVQNRKYYEENNLCTAKGVLLYGPKGCGKTLLAKALANECNINFLPVNGAELLNMYLGESERAVRECFRRARYSAPCVIFFDEFDALCPSRQHSNSNAAAERVVNTLLTEMDGMQERKQVFVIAATNRVEKIDSAMLRPGRLDKLIFVDLPSSIGRYSILNSLSKNKTKPKMGDDVDLKKIAFDKRCEDFSGADLAFLIQEAIQHALKEIIDVTDNKPSFILNMNHFDKALETVRPSFNDEDRKYFSKNRLQSSKD